MKASDYSARFAAEGGTIEALGKVLADMLVEVREIGKARRIRTDESLLAILDEMYQRFRSFHRQIGGKLKDGSLVREDAFPRILKVKMPEIFSVWNGQHRGAPLLIS